MSDGAPRTADYLRHMRDAIGRALHYTAGMTFEQFLSDERTQDAVIRNLEVLGEAARNVVRDDPAFAALHADMPWALMYRLRNRVAHGYFDIDWTIVWSTLQQALPPLQARINQIIEQHAP